MSPPDTKAFQAKRSHFTARMARGHYMRLGHELTGYYEPTETAGIVRLVRTCCQAEEVCSSTSR